MISRFFHHITPTLFIVLFLQLTHNTLAQTNTPLKQWDKTYGGDGDDALRKLRQTPDGGYILVGISLSGVSGDKGQPALGSYDYWVVKTDAQGSIQWEHTFGGSGFDNLQTVRLTADGGYLLAGYSETGIEGDKSEKSRGLNDYWIIKLDASGRKQWDKTLGGRYEDHLFDAIQTLDGGYLVAGHSESDKSGDKSGPNTGDFWIVKLDPTGRKQWDQTYGSLSGDVFSSVCQTSDGGYILGGSSIGGATGDKSQPTRGEHDYWVIKIDANGSKQWDKTFGGSATDYLKGVQQTKDGGYILGGWSNSPTSQDKSEANTGIDFWVIKTDASGNREWDRTVRGGSLVVDYLFEIQQTSDEGYILGGESFTENLTNPIYGKWNYWIVKLAANGLQQWDQSYTGGGSDDLQAVQQTFDGGYVLGGTSRSGQSGDKSEQGKGEADFWVIKLAEARISGDPRLCSGGKTELIAPNGFQSYLWNTGETTHLITVTAPGLYTVQCTYSNGTFIQIQQKVDFTTFPPPVISGDSILCNNTSGQLSAHAVGALSYQWNTGATTAIIPITQAGVYVVTASFPNGCTSQATYRVRNQASIPTFTLGGDTTLCDGESLVLQVPVLPPGSTFKWSDGSQNPSFRITAPGRYALQCTTACGAFVVYKQVDFTSCLVIPNIITPDKDHLNDRFIVGQLPQGNWQLSIYDRWGKHIYHTDAYQNDWGENAPAGTYYYWLRDSTTGRTYKGWLEVAR